VAHLWPGFYPGNTSAYPTGAGSGPTAATIITATPEPDATPPRIRLDIVTDRTTLILYRVAQDGTKDLVRTYDGGPFPIGTGSGFIYDVDAPQGEPVRYTIDGDDTVTSSTVTVDSGRTWLVDPAVPTRSVPVELADMSDRSAGANQSIRYPIGRRFPIVANDGVRKADTYTLTLRTRGQGELVALKALLADLPTLLLNVPGNTDWVDLTTEYIAVGDLTRSNKGGYVQFDEREWALQCAVADRPTVGTQAFVTYGYSKRLYPTYGARKAAHATYGEAFDPE
jgi:hypothetical protein